MKDIEEERKRLNYYMTYDIIKNKWVLNFTDPKTSAVTEKKVFQNGMWRKLEEKNVQR